MAVNNFNRYNYKDNRMGNLASDTVSILYQTINQIKRNGNDKNTLEVLTHSISALTSVLQPYVNNTPKLKN
tara:strand:+ start:3154 stop:3366 length:213 start_codon:yes stop_codon:yes gene_type:complete